jgi:hypothetical protein
VRTPGGHCPGQDRTQTKVPSVAALTGVRHRGSDDLRVRPRLEEPAGTAGCSRELAAGKFGLPCVSDAGGRSPAVHPMGQHRRGPPYPHRGRPLSRRAFTDGTLRPANGRHCPPPDAAASCIGRPEARPLPIHAADLDCLRARCSIEQRRDLQQPSRSGERRVAISLKSGSGRANVINSQRLANLGSPGCCGLVGERVAAGVAQHLGMSFSSRPAPAAARSTMQSKPAGERGAAPKSWSASRLRRYSR